MSYRSPLHIIKGIADPDFVISEKNLLRLRKQLLAELNLSGEIFLRIQGKEYSKDEIIKTIDTLLNNPDLPVHEFIYQDKKLLAFLETDSLNYPLKAIEKLQPPEDVKEKLSALLEDRFVLQLKKAFSKREFGPAIEAVKFFAQLKEERKTRNYEEVNRSILSLVNFHNEIYAQIKKNNNDRYSTGCISGYNFRYLERKYLAKFMNELPAEFNETIIMFEASVINLMYQYHKQSEYDKTLTANISSMLMEIRMCDTENYRIIRNNHKVYSKKENSVAAGGWLVIMIVVIVVRILAFSVGSGSSTSSYGDGFRNLSAPPVIFHKQDNTTPEIDSIFSLTQGDQVPHFAGMEGYLKSQLHYPEKAIEKGVSGTVHVSFVVETDGSLSNVRALDSIGSGCEEEALRVVKAMPNWKPGWQRGKRVRVQFNLPVKFTLK